MVNDFEIKQNLRINPLLFAKKSAKSCKSRAMSNANLLSPDVHSQQLLHTRSCIFPFHCTETSYHHFLTFCHRNSLSLYTDSIHFFGIGDILSSFDIQRIVHLRIFTHCCWPAESPKTCICTIGVLKTNVSKIWVLNILWNCAEF